MALSIDEILRMSTDDIISLSLKDLYILPHDDLKKVVAKVQNTVHQRVIKLKKAGYNTPALQNLYTSGGELSTRGKSTNSQLVTEIARGRIFLQDITSTTKGAYESAKNMSQATNSELTSEQLNKLWSAFNRLKELFPSEYFDSNQVIEYLHNEIMDNPDVTIDELIELATIKLQSEYESYEPDTEDFFTI